MRGRNPHAAAEARSLRLHRAVADRIRSDPTLLEAARARVEAWRRDGSVAPAYVDAWEETLSAGASCVVALLCDPGERAASLRQVSPFAGVLDPRERWRLLESA